MLRTSNIQVSRILRKENEILLRQLSLTTILGGGFSGDRIRRMLMRPCEAVASSWETAKPATTKKPLGSNFAKADAEAVRR